MNEQCDDIVWWMILYDYVDIDDENNDPVMKNERSVRMIEMDWLTNRLECDDYFVQMN